MTEQDRLFFTVVVLPLVVVLGVAGAATWMLTPETPVHQPPVSMCCFPEGTELPYPQGFFGDRHPAMPGCVDYRLNEGMET